MTESGLLLGIDLGTTRVKALLVDARGRPRGFGSAETPFESAGGNVEMSFDAFKSAIAAAIRNLGDGVTSVAGVGIASMGETGVPLDHGHRPSGPMIAWHDSRGTRVVRRLDETFGDDLPARVGQLTRLQSSIAKMGWFVQHDVKVERWLGAAESTLWALSGEEASEPSLACRTGAFDVREQSFITDVLESVGVPATVFPPVRQAGEAHGVVSYQGRSWLGLPVGVPVTVAGHDHMVGAVGVGLGGDDLLDSIGTAETLVRYTAEDLDFMQAASLEADVSLDPATGRLAIMAGDLRPGRIVESARKMLGDGSFEELELSGAGPHADAELPAADGLAFLEQLRAQDKPESSEAPAHIRWRGLIEAMTSYMWNTALRIEPLAGRPLRIVLIGGGARSQTWATAKRRISRLPVVRSRVEATAYGAALFAGCAAGYWPSIHEAPRAAIEVVEA